ncbi:MAG: ABC transporter substrate-binding protein [Cetobacterium sp.]|uniref:ABC transporter substrate-binding protein n=1 Tax=Cetobacterium sp. ZWU0022 TaxID=1340502 RepID=UPI00064577AC|nr:ABC transporter substrate-binding protein [Cetobacterium sp. ZWU0022]
MKKLFLFLLLTTLTFSSDSIRVVSTSQFTTEMLLAIGAEDYLIGTSFLDDEILPELQQKYNKIPVLAAGAPTKELFYSLNPTFLTGWQSIATPKNLGTIEELKENGVEVFFTKSQKTSNIDDIYEDILYFGKRFNLEKNANQVVKNMKSEIEEVKSKNLGKKKIKIFAYDSQESAPFVIGGNGIGNTMMEIAGAENIFRKSSFSFGTGSWEKILDENPLAIIVIDYGDKSYESKIDFLKNRSPISELEAVKKDRFIRIPLSYLSSGIKVSKGIEKISEGLSEEQK